MRDIVFLVADGEMQATVEGFFENDAYDKRLNCERFEFNSKLDLVKHPQKDPGVFQTGHYFIKGYLQTHSYAVIMLDAQFGGAPEALIMRQKIKDNMIKSGWLEEQFYIMVIDPELEVLMWQEDTRGIEQIINYPGEPGALKQWLNERNLWPEDLPKPPDPKAAIDKIRGQSWGRKKTHSQNFKRVASEVSFKKCQDEAFVGLWQQLMDWYPVVYL